MSETWPTWTQECKERMSRQQNTQDLLEANKNESQTHVSIQAHHLQELCLRNLKRLGIKWLSPFDTLISNTLGLAF